MSKKGSLGGGGRDSSLTILLSSLVFVFISLKFYYKNISLSWTHVLLYYSTSFASPITKPVGPCYWIMKAFGTLNYMVSMTLFPCCKPKCNRDEFNNNNQFTDFPGPWDNFMVHGVNNP